MSSWSHLLAPNFGDYLTDTHIIWDVTRQITTIIRIYLKGDALLSLLSPHTFHKLLKYVINDIFILRPLYAISKTRYNKIINKVVKVEFDKLDLEDHRKNIIISEIISREIPVHIYGL